MINSLSYIKRKAFFEPLVNYTTDDPLYEHIETSIKAMFVNEDYKIQKEKFLKNARAIHASMTNSGDTDLRLFLYFNIPIFILFALVGIRMLSFVGEPLLILFILIFIIGRPLFVSYNFITGFNELKKREKHLLSTSIFLDQSSYPNVWQPILEISSKSRLNTDGIKVLYLKENHFVPTVTDLKRLGTQLIVITIPRNLLILSKQNPRMYESIIAHEMSHLTQGDSGIWMYYFLDFKCAYTLKDFFLNLIQGKEERLRKKYKIYNSSAEYLADLGSIILTEDIAIFDFLRSPFVSDTEDDFHPSINSRISFLKSFLYKQAKSIHLPVNTQWTSRPEVLIEKETVILHENGEMSEGYKTSLLELSKAIRDEQKKMWGGGITMEIENLLHQLASSKQEAIQLIDNYQAVVKRGIVKDLIKINNSYGLIRRNVSFFIERDVIEDSFPYERKKPLVEDQILK